MWNAMFERCSAQDPSAQSSFCWDEQCFCVKNRCASLQSCNDHRHNDSSCCTKQNKMSFSRFATDCCVVWASLSHHRWWCVCCSPGQPSSLAGSNGAGANWSRDAEGHQFREWVLDAWVLHEDALHCAPFWELRKNSQIVLQHFDDEDKWITSMFECTSTTIRDILFWMFLFLSKHGFCFHSDHNLIKEKKLIIAIKWKQCLARCCTSFTKWWNQHQACGPPVLARHGPHANWQHWCRSFTKLIS